MFPDAPLARLDRDTVHSAADVEAVMHSLLDGSARILVGTQMVTKGHHFPGVSLVAVINADQGLFSADFRAAERLAQTIVQVAGRAGRGARAGEVLIQTEYPEHPLLQSLISNGYEGFAAGALAERAERTLAAVRTARAAARLRRECRGGAAISCAKRASLPRQRLRQRQSPARAGAGQHGAPRGTPLRAAARSKRRRAANCIASWSHGCPIVERLPGARRVRWALDVDPLDIQ